MTSGEDRPLIDIAALLDGSDLLRTTAAAPDPISLMITQVQKARLRELGYSVAAISEMTPADAHAILGLSK